MEKEINTVESTEDRERARALLLSKGYTCVLCRKDQVVSSALRGVKPLVLWCLSGEDYSVYAAADKVVGRATAFLYQLLGVRTLYAAVISSAALEVLEQAGISVEYGELVAHIINRRGDGICPFEEAVLSVSDPRKAFEIVLRKMREMNIDFN